SAHKVIAILRRRRLFGGLEPDDLAACAKAFTEKHLDKGQTLFLRGDPGTHLYLVEAGRIRLATSTANGRRLTFQHATEGDLFGEIAALDGKPRTADATAITEAKLLCLERVAFRELCAAPPEGAAGVVTFLSRRIRQMTPQFESVALEPLYIRLARFILSALGSHTAPPGRRIPLELGFSQSELSQLLGASRPKVNAA